MDDPEKKEIGKVLEVKMSATIGQLFGALSVAQGKMTNAKKSSVNPFFDSKYANLATCLDFARLPLSESKLAVVQLPFFEGGAVGVQTMLSHESGEWVMSTLKLKPTKMDPQGVGSAITYARRYAFASMVGLAQADDDGETHRPEEARAEARADRAQARAESRWSTTKKG